MALWKLGILVAVTLALALASTRLAFEGVGRPVVGIDDANIFFAYARNIASGAGFVYGPKGERVEGFTSLLWVLVCALATSLSGRPETLLLGLNVALVALTVAAVGWFAWHELSDRGYATSYAVCATATVLFWSFSSPTYVCWSTISLMETALWGAVFTAGTLFAARSAGGRRSEPGRSVSGLSAVIAVALVTRPESMLVAAVWVATAALASLASGVDLRECARRYLGPTAVYLVTLTALITFRLLYFGYPLPNTYYAKVSPSAAYNLHAGTDYLGKFLVAHRFAAVCFGAAVVTIVRFLNSVRSPRPADAEGREPAARRPEARTFVVSCSILAGVMIPVLSGGDHFVFFRFYQPIWPLLSLPLVIVAGGITQASRSHDPLPLPMAARAVWGLVVGLIFLCIYADNRPRWDGFQADEINVHRFANEFDLAIKGRLIGLELNHLLSVDPSLSVGVVAAGGIAVTFEGTTVDLMGLNNVKMGHSTGDRKGIKNHAAFNPRVFYELHPDLVNPWLVNEASRAEDLRDAREFDRECLKGLFEAPRFRSEYCLVQAPFHRGERSFVAWMKYDVIPRLRGRGVALKIISWE